MKRRDVRDRMNSALKDDHLRRAVKKTTDAFLNGRNRAVAETDNWESLRDQAAALRRHTMEHIHDYMEQLAANVRHNGGHIHFAKTAEDARRIVRNIARDYAVKTVAKSKSMISEEIELNDALQRENIDVVETDLGEYILQLGDDTPSHLVGPALHKSREEMTRILSDEKGEPLSSDTPTLTAFARERLRDVFLKADMGITGCNFAVAETGSVTLVTNEGNGRMVTALPDVQVTLMGMERIVPRLEDLDLMVSMLTRSATGQETSTYVSINSGPRSPDENDGPKAFHLVVVDNGRSALLGTEFEEALHCIRCAACLNVCPVYRQVGGHAYGWIYSGPIGAILTPLFKGTDDWGDVADASSLCGACDEVCPVKIPIHDLLIRIRERTRTSRGQSRLERLAFRLFGSVASRPQAYRRTADLGRFVQKAAVKDGHIQKAPPPFHHWLKHRTLPPLADRNFRRIWREQLKDEQRDEPIER